MLNGFIRTVSNSLSMQRSSSTAAGSGGDSTAAAFEAFGVTPLHTAAAKPDGGAAVRGLLASERRDVWARHVAKRATKSGVNAQTTRAVQIGGTRFEAGTTPLMVALGNERWGAVRLLLHDPAHDPIEHQGWTALHVAAAIDDGGEAMRELLELHAPPPQRAGGR